MLTMNRFRAYAVVGTLIVILALGASTAARADGTGVGCGLKGCGVGAVDPGAPGGGSSPGGGGSGGAGSGTGGTGGTGGSGPTTPQPTCSAEPVNPQPEPGSPFWNGHTAAEGSVMHYVCSGGVAPGVITPFFQATGAAAPAAPPPPPPPPPDPAVLAQQAYKQIPIPKPQINFGPDVANVAVQVPVWLWVNRQTEAAVTVTAGGVSVTATPELQSVTWSMGEPVDPAAPAVLAAPITCTGESMYVVAPQYPGWSTQPACGYTYSWRSTAARTGGTFKWPVTASATWVINWASNTGQTGQITAPPAVSASQLNVGEWITVGVPPSK